MEAFTNNKADLTGPFWPCHGVMTNSEIRECLNFHCMLVNSQ